MPANRRTLRKTPDERASRYMRVWMGFTPAEMTNDQNANQLFRHFTQFARHVEMSVTKAMRKATRKKATDAR